MDEPAEVEEHISAGISDCALGWLHPTEGPAETFHHKRGRLDYITLSNSALHMVSKVLSVPAEALYTAAGSASNGHRLLIAQLELPAPRAREKKHPKAPQAADT